MATAPRPDSFHFILQHSAISLLLSLMTAQLCKAHFKTISNVATVLKIEITLIVRP